MRRWSTLAALWLLVVGSLVVLSQVVTWLTVGKVSQELAVGGFGMVMSAWAVVKTAWSSEPEPPPPGTGDSPSSSQSPSP